MTPGSSRRESLIERVGAIRATLDRMELLDAETLFAGVPAWLRPKLEAPRFLSRLSLRRARRITSSRLFTPVTDARESVLLEGGAEQISSLCATVGAHICWQSVLRIVRREDALSLNSALGVPARQAALRGRERAIDVSPHAADHAVQALANVIQREGALSWACWVSARDTASARRLRVITPASVTSVLTDCDLGDEGMRARRRDVVDQELNAVIESFEQVSRGDI